MESGNFIRETSEIMSCNEIVRNDVIVAGASCADTSGAEQLFDDENMLPDNENAEILNSTDADNDFDRLARGLSTETWGERSKDNSFANVGNRKDERAHESCLGDSSTETRKQETSSFGSEGFTP